MSVNQCDGCRRGIPVNENGVHVGPAGFRGGDFMACTADRYTDETDCREPCDPDVGCPHCAEYWQRMEREGFWDAERHRWTDRGWKEIVKP